MVTALQEKVGVDWRTGEDALPEADPRSTRSVLSLKENVKLGGRSIYLINNAAISVIHLEENKATSSPPTYKRDPRLAKDLQ